jgi:drug/metabolite transporter (DMT)-like permease
VLFGGVTVNSVANAALIGALSPFLIVPIGAWLFGEYFSWPAMLLMVAYVTSARQFRGEMNVTRFMATG